MHQPPAVATPGRRPRGVRRALAVVSPVAGLALLGACGTPTTASAARATPPAAAGGVAAVGAGAIPAPTGPAPSGSRPAPSATSVPQPTGQQRFATLRSDVGRTVVTTLTGPRSNVKLRVWVWLPPQYDDPRYAHSAFPALMLFPGGSGAGYNTWVGRQYGARELVARERSVSPFVFVMPEMQLSERRDTECADLPGQPKVGTFLAVDVRQMVEQNFRVLRDRTGWGAAGASSGAYCAARLVFNHPDQYRAVVSIGGYYTIETGLPGAKEPAVLAGDPAAIARTSPPDVAVLVWSGGSNAIDLAGARTFLRLLRPPTTGTLQVLPGGRHLTVDFAKMMPGSFAFLTRTLATVTPPA